MPQAMYTLGCGRMASTMEEVDYQKKMAPSLKESGRRGKKWSLCPEKSERERNHDMLYRAIIFANSKLEILTHKMCTYSYQVII